MANKLVCAVQQLGWPGLADHLAKEMAHLIASNQRKGLCGDGEPFSVSVMFVIKTSPVSEQLYSIKT
jgi:hypothetical protein